MRLGGPSGTTGCSYESFSAPPNTIVRAVDVVHRDQNVCKFEMQTHGKLNIHARPLWQVLTYCRLTRLMR
jgi:hypothetical protein